MANTKVPSELIADNSVGITQLNVSDGTNGQVLTTNGSGTLSFSTISGYTDSDVETYLDGGTSTPTFADLNVVNTSGNAVVDITASTTGLSRLNLGDSGGATRGGLKYDHSDDSLVIRTNGSDKVTIDSSGKVGIGSSPSYTLDVAKDFGSDPGVRVWNKNGNWGTKSSINFLTDVSDSSNYPEGLISLFRGTSSDADSGMEFSAGTSSQTVRIKYHATKGEVLINRSASFGTGSSAALIVGNTGSETTIRVLGPNTNNYNLMTFYNAGLTAIGTIKNDNNTGVTYESASDYRLKENYNYDWDATTVLKQLRPLKFNWIADESNTEVEGFLAHEVQEVMPHLVSGEKDAVKEAYQDEDGNDLEGTTIDPQTLDYARLVPLLVKTTQEQQTIIDDLKSRIETLENN